MTTGTVPSSTNPDVDAAAVADVIEYYYAQNWTDGLPVVPATETVVERLLGKTPRKPDDVLFAIKHLNRALTVRSAAINAVMAGCQPEYFPVVVAAWEAIAKEPHPKNGIWQSTTGSAPLTVVNGPVRTRLNINSQGNIFGSGHRANATIGRAIRLGLLNVFGLKPHQLDQATQGTPAKYTLCIAENEEQSPWDPLHTEYGFAANQDVVTEFVIRSVIHIEARQTALPDQLARDFVNTIVRTGSLIHEYTNVLLVLAPEHAHLFADAGWSKEDLRNYVYESAVLPRHVLTNVGKDAISNQTQWRLASDHPDARGDSAKESDQPDLVHVLAAPSSTQIMVGGADNSGVSAVVEILGLRSQVHSSSNQEIVYSSEPKGQS